MSTHIGVLFDKNFLLPALALYESARTHVPDPKFYFLCLDQAAAEVLSKLKLDNVRTLRLSDLEDPELEPLRDSRSKSEFAWTCKPGLMLYIAKNAPKDEWMIYLDSDIYFFSSLESTLRSMNSYSISITPHRFKENRRFMRDRVGYYNAGMIFFKNDNNSRECLNEWRGQCIEWCFYPTEDGKQGDQMYLDHWKKKYQGVYDIPDKGVNAATWNTEPKDISICGNRASVFDQPLVCWHFHGLKIYRSIIGKIKPYPINVVNEFIFSTYTNTLNNSEIRILDVEPNWPFEMAKRPGVLRWIKQKIQSDLRNRGIIK